MECFEGKEGWRRKLYNFSPSVQYRMAIKMHSATQDINQLRYDLHNEPSHVFGDHSYCTSQFCAYSTTVVWTMQEDSNDPVDDTLLHSPPPLLTIRWQHWRRSGGSKRRMSMMHDWEVAHQLVNFHQDYLAKYSTWHGRLTFFRGRPALVFHG